jgi:trk system potassium uptake protein TrkA
MNIVMNIIVVGSGRVGSELAHNLSNKGHKVTVVDSRPSALDNLGPNFPGRTIEGDPLNRDVLHRAGIKSADGLAAVTNSDTMNLAICHIAREKYHVTNVIARNYTPQFRSLFEIFDLQVVSSSSWGAQRIEELLYHRDVRTVFSAGNGEVEVYEFTIPEAWNGHTLGELLPEVGCSTAGLTRTGKASLPEPDTVLQTGDVVMVSATLDGIRALRSKYKQGLGV